MLKCYYCGQTFNGTDVRKHKEHIIQNAIGGTLKPDDILCQKCGGDLGELIDVPFINIFKNISMLLDVKRDRINVNRKIKIETITDKYGELELDLASLKVYPIKPFCHYNHHENKLHVYAHERIIKQFREKAKRELSKKGIYPEEIILVDNLMEYPEIKFNIPFTIDNVKLKLGLAKIAMGFASYNNIDRTLLPCIFNAKENSFNDHLCIIPFVPMTQLDYVIESLKHQMDTDYPNHLLILFSISYGEKNHLYCYIELFSTFQYYVLLNKDFGIKNYHKIYAQKIISFSPSEITRSISPKDLHMYLSDLHLTEMEKTKITSLYMSKDGLDEAIRLLNAKYQQQKYNFNPEVYLKELFDTFLTLRCLISGYQSTPDNKLRTRLSQLIPQKYLSNGDLMSYFDSMTKDLAKFISFFNDITFYLAESDSNKRFLIERYKIYFRRNECICSYPASCLQLTHNQDKIREYTFSKFNKLMQYIFQKIIKMSN